MGERFFRPAVTGKSAWRTTHGVVERAVQAHFGFGRDERPTKRCGIYAFVLPFGRARKAAMTVSGSKYSPQELNGKVGGAYEAWGDVEGLRTA